MESAFYAAWWVILAALAMDLLFGDPPWLPHPVRGMGWLIERLERRLWTGRRLWDLWAGSFVVFVTVSLTAVLVWMALAAASLAGAPLAHLLSALLSWTALALRGLGDAARNVAVALEEADLPRARMLLPALVGRDPEQLDRAGIVRATVESVAENTSDGLVAPLFYLTVAGPAGALAYKAVNTLDSMIGHDDDRYRFFGRAAARLDDAANYVPARLTALLLVLTAGLTVGGASAKTALSTTLRDGRKHASPNAGRPEAAVAGALGLRLGGPAVYAGVIDERAFLGSGDRVPEVTDIHKAATLMYLSAALAVPFLLGARALVCAVFD